MVHAALAVSLGRVSPLQLLGQPKFPGARGLQRRAASSGASTEEVPRYLGVRDGRGMFNPTRWLLSQRG